VTVLVLLVAIEKFVGVEDCVEEGESEIVDGVGNETNRLQFMIETGVRGVPITSPSLLSADSSSSANKRRS